MLSKVLAAFNIETSATILPFGTGLINHTWKIVDNGKEYILQRINHHVFREPWNIAENITMIGDYLRANHPDYLFTLPIKTAGGNNLFFDDEEGYFRLFPFVTGSHTIDVVESPEQAYAAAYEFGKFTKLLGGFAADQLKTTIPDFHNLVLRYSGFLQSLTDGDPERIKIAGDSIRTALANEHIVEQYKEIIQNPGFHTRVIHHDTKISNVLFDESENGLCVIDLDTVMPGYFISDVGDMMRTYLCPVSEEETDLEKIMIRKDFFTAIVNGYSDQMHDQLTSVEKQYFLYAGQFMIYMQAIRFLTDYLYNDVYYGSRYPGHNLVRTNNQLVLLQKLSEHSHLAKSVS